MSKNIGKLLSYILRHNPVDFNLTIDKNGWVMTKDLIQSISVNEGLGAFNFDELKGVVKSDDKGRFEFNDNETMVRAVQGHSLSDVELEYEDMEPPEILYHGTVSKFIRDIKFKGLIKKERNHVHLSEDVFTANHVASRRGSPIILTIETKRMFDDGYRFKIANNGVWLVDSVPSKYIKYIKYTNGKD